MKLINKISLLTIVLLMFLSIGMVTATDNTVDSNITDLNIDSQVSLDNNNFSNQVLFTDSENSTITDDHQNYDLEFNNTVSTNLTADSIVMFYKNGTKYEITLTDSNGSSLSNQNISILINGVTYNRITNENGSAFLSINLVPGEYSVTGTFNGTSQYNSSNVTSKVTVLSNIISENITKYYKNGTQYMVTVVDGVGNPLADQTVSITINGATYTRKTNENGSASLNINLKPGTYNITTSYGPIKVLNTVTVLSVLNGTDIVKYYQNGTRYVVNLIDGVGNPLANQTVTISINGKDYTKTTDENGSASLGINLVPGVYTITSSYNGMSINNNVTVLSVLNGTDIVKYYQNGTRYVVNLIDGVGNPLANQTVTISINGKDYTKTTDENGSASLGINLVPGVYTITSSYNGMSINNNVTVLSTIVLTDLTTTYKKTGYYNVKVVDNTGNPLANQSVNITINGATYHRTTNASGETNLAINLVPGTYTAVVSCNGLTSSSKITVNKMSSKLSVLTPVVTDGKYQLSFAEKDSGKAISNLYVVLIYNNQGYWAITNNDGVATWRVGLPSGSYNIIVGIYNDPIYETSLLYTKMIVE